MRTTSSFVFGALVAGIILGKGLVNKRRYYNITSSLIGWAHTQNDSWGYNTMMHHSVLCIIYITSNDYEINLGEMPVLNVKVTSVHAQ